MTVIDVGAPRRLSAPPTENAVLLVAHGSARYPDAGRPAAAHVARLRASRLAGLGLLNGTPSVQDALAGLDAAVIRVVPFFMEDGYFTRVAVPAALGADPRVVLCPPVGVHDGMAALIAEIVRQGCSDRGLDPASTAVLLVGHGSGRSPGRAMALVRHTATLAAGGEFALVRAACLEEPPFLPNALADLRAHPVAVVGFLAGEGRHMRDDVPTALHAEAAARGGNAPPVHNFGAVADNQAMTRIILDQAASA
jgi:sirohydrochlorin cobaltochelatase